MDAPEAVGDRGLGTRVRDLRRGRNMSQADLAADDLSPSYVSLVEAGRRVPSHEVVLTLAERLGVTADYLRTGQEEQREVTARAELAFLRMALDHDEHDAVIGRAEALQESMGPDWARRDEVDYLLACACEATGDLERACRLLEPVAARARAGTTEVSLAASHLVLAGCYIEAGDAARAAEVADLGLGCVEDAGWRGDPDVPRLAATAVWAYLERGDALYASLKAQDYLEQLPDDAPPQARAGLLWNEALARNARGQHRAALALITRASALMSEGDGGRDQTRGQMARAWLMLRAPEPDLDEVLRLLDDVRTRLEAAGATVDLATCELELARAHLLAGDPHRAAAFAEQARERLGDERRALSADLAAVLARARLATGDTGSVGQLLDEVGAHLDQVPPGRSSAVAWTQLAHVLRAAAEPDRALDAALRALEATGVRASWTALPGQLTTTPAAVRER